MSQVKGSKISLKLAFVKEHYGEEKLAELIASMDTADRLALKIVLDTGWYGISLYQRLVIAICRICASGDETVYDRIGAHSAQLSLDSVYKVFQAKNPLVALKNMAPLHSLMNDPGEMTVTPGEAGHCVVTVVEPKSIPEICRVARAFYKRTVELCGGNQVVVDHRLCSGNGERFCEFDIRWQLNPS